MVKCILQLAEMICSVVTDKTKCLIFSSKKCRIEQNVIPSFFINESVIESVKQWPHFGHLLDVNGSDSAEILLKRNATCKQINSVLCLFAKRDTFVKIRLLQAFCFSFYGCVLWDLLNHSIDDFCICVRKGLKRAWSLPANAHSILVGIISCMVPVHMKIQRHTLLFIIKCLKCDSFLVNYVTKYGVYYGRMYSPIGRNPLFCCN